MADFKKMAAAPEAQHALNCRTSDNLLKAEFEAQDRKSERYRRKMDREIFNARQGLTDIKARTPSPRSAGGQPVDRRPLTADLDPDLLGSKTKRNLALSQRISSSLEVKRQQREASPISRSGDPHYAGQAVSVSPRAVEDLQKAATVLKNTRHEAEVLKLLTSVQPAVQGVGSARSPRS